MTYYFANIPRKSQSIGVPSLNGIEPILTTDIRRYIERETGIGGDMRHPDEEPTAIQYIRATLSTLLALEGKIPGPKLCKAEFPSDTQPENKTSLKILPNGEIIEMRLQTKGHWNTLELSNTQSAKILANAWTNILTQLKYKTQQSSEKIRWVIRTNQILNALQELPNLVNDPEEQKAFQQAATNINP